MPSVTRSSGSARGARRQEAQDRLTAALEQLLESGVPFTTITVDQLIEASGVPRSSFYLYFSDKAHLLRSVTSGLGADYLEACQDWWHLPADAGRDTLRAAFERMLDAYLPHRRLMAAFIETSAYDHDVRAGYQELLDLHLQEVADHIRRGQQDGTVHEEVDPDRAAIWLTYLIERGLYEFASGAPEKERSRYLDAWTDIVWNALYARTR